MATTTTTTATSDAIKYRLNVFELPKISVDFNGTEVLVKGALDYSAKYNRIKTYMLYIPTRVYGVYRLLICNWDGRYKLPAAKRFYVDIANKDLFFDCIPEDRIRDNAAVIISKYNEIVTCHRKGTTANPAIATTANPEDEAYTEEAAV